MLAAAVSVPLLAGTGLDLAAWTALGLVCHQLPDRSWAWSGLPLGLCVRCLGIYAGVLLGALAGLRFSRTALAGAAAANLLLWLGEDLLGGAAEAARFSGGLLLGATAIAAIVPKMHAKKRRRQQLHPRDCVPLLHNEVGGSRRGGSS